MEDYLVRAVLNKMLELEEKISFLDPKKDKELIYELRLQEIKLQHQMNVLIPA